MHLRFLGTGAADFSPLLETELRDRLDVNARRSSSVLIEGRFLIDCGPHVLDSMGIQGLDAAAVTDLFLTHLHSDHCDWDNIRRLAAETRQPLRIWCREDAPVEEIPGARLCPLQIGQTVETGGLTVTALEANHTSFPLHYDLEYDGKRLFYGCDGAWILYDTFYAIRGRRFDMMILDATVGDYAGDFRVAEHNSLPMLRLMAASFRSQGVVAPDGQIWLSHIARTLHKPHDELVEQAAADRFLVARDGLEVEI